MCVFASKGAHVVYMNLSLQLHDGIQLVDRLHLVHESVLDMAIFDVLN
jgi:hypothetical protein